MLKTIPLLNIKIIKIYYAEIKFNGCHDKTKCLPNNKA